MQEVGRKPQAIQSIKLAPAELKELLDELDGYGTERDEFSSRRQHARLRCRTEAVLVTIDQPGQRVAFSVPLRNISDGGAAFLHRSMLHNGTPCTFAVLLVGGGRMKVPAKVVRCRHIRGMIYEIGLKFDRAVDLRQLVVEGTELPDNQR